MAIEITTSKTNQEIFNSLIETASRKYKVHRNFEACGNHEEAKEYEDEWNGIIEAISTAFDVHIARVIKETSKK